MAVDTFRNDTSGYTPELKWSVLKVLLKVSTAKTGCHGSVSKIPYYLRGSVLKVSTAQGISLVSKSSRVKNDNAYLSLLWIRSSGNLR